VNTSRVSGHTANATVQRCGGRTKAQVKDRLDKLNEEIKAGEALASSIAALGGKLELVADIGGHLPKMPANPAA
jgi:hypothetical protein